MHFGFDYAVELTDATIRRDKAMPCLYICGSLFDELLSWHHETVFDVSAPQEDVPRRAVLWKVLSEF